MYPTLIQFGSIRIDTYSVIWFIALSLAILWSIKRLELYQIDEDEARRVMAVSFVFMLLGARLPEYFKNFSDYINNPSLLLDLNRGGLYEFGAVLGAFISALVMCSFSRKVSFLKLCEVAAIPAMLAIAVGRWGCFLNGCCLGAVSDIWCAVHFPNDKAGILRHPVQIYYSLCSAVIVMILLYVEKKIITRHEHSIIAPSALILYSVMRVSLSFTREALTLSELVKQHWTYMAILILLPLEFLWLMYGLPKNRKKAPDSISGR